MGEVCITDAMRLRQGETKQLKILKYLNKDSREAGNTGNIKCRLDSDKFTYHRKVWQDTNGGIQTGTVIARTITKIMKLIGKNLKEFLKKLKMEKFRTLQTWIRK